MTTFKATPRSALAEVFLINETAVTPLRGFRLSTSSGGDANTIGGKLAYQLQKRLNGRWAWSMTEHVLLTTEKATAQEVAPVLADLWKEMPDPFSRLRNVSEASDWSASATAKAEFAVMALIRCVESSVRRELNKEPRPLRANVPVDVVREPIFSAWEVDGKPAVSVSVSSRLICNQDLATFLRHHSLDDLDDLMLTDVDRQHTSVFEEIVEGGLGMHRPRLLSYKSRPSIMKLIENGADDVPVMTVRNLGGRNTYDYPATALYPVVTTAKFKLFDVDSKKARFEMVLDPKRRSDLVRSIRDIVNNQSTTKDLLAQSITDTPDQPGRFMKGEDLGFSNEVQIGKGQSSTFDNKGKHLYADIKRHGPFRRRTTDKDLRIGVICMPREQSWQRQEGDLLRLLKEAGCPSVIAGREMVQDTRRNTLQMAVDNLAKQADLILFVLPEEIGDESEDEELSPYIRFKQATIPYDIPGQAVYMKTLEKSYTMENLALGIMAKGGCLPFALKEPLPYADVVIGLDVARKAKGRLQGSINAAATARIYNNTGEFLRYWMPDHQIEGETIPRDVLEGMFPGSEFSGKRILVHRDGRFRGEERESLYAWAKEINATMYCVEVIKSGSPRLYALEQVWNEQKQKNETKVVQPPKGLCLRLNDHEAFLVSSLPPFENSTPQPLQIKTDGNLSIEQACHSVLALTVVHVGSKLAPRLPVTVHFADQIAEFALKGIKPRTPQGTLPFWL